MIRVFDLETVANVQMIPRMPEPTIKAGNVKDEAKLEAKKDEAREKQIQSMGLSPITGRICAFAMVAADKKAGKWEVQEKKSGVLKTLTDKEESNLVETILADLKISNDTYDRIVTFNGMEFDIPFLYGRAMMLQIPAPGYSLSVWSRRFTNKPHYDIRKVLTNWEYNARGSLDYFAKMILGVEKDEPDYLDFLAMFNDGKGQEILDSCVQHTDLTFDLYKRIEKYYN